MPLTPYDYDLMRRYLEKAGIAAHDATRVRKARFEYHFASDEEGFAKWTVTFYRYAQVAPRDRTVDLTYYTRGRRAELDVDPVEVFTDNVNAASLAMRLRFEEWASVNKIPADDLARDAYQAALRIGADLGAFFRGDMTFEWDRLAAHGTSAVTGD